MSEICKCGIEMKFLREYKNGDFKYYEYICKKCDRKKIYQVCPNCEDSTSWWEE